MHGNRKWLIYYLGGWGFMALYFTSWDAVRYSSSLGKLLLLNGLQNLVWAVLGLGLVWLSEHRPIEGFTRREWRTWGLHLIASLLATLVGLFLAFLISLAFSDGHSPKAPDWFWKSVRYFYGYYLHTNLLIMLALVGGIHALRLQRKLQARELTSARLEARFLAAQHQALRMQLQPHFLFNTLNSISALVHSDPEAADRMISRLGDFLRMTLEEGSQAEVTLKKEMAFIEAYLAIERVRFRDRLKVVVDIAPDLMAQRIPSFLLQPLVENALKHGLEGRPQGGTLNIRARKEGAELVIEVQDDGLGYRPGREGVGLSNVRSRLGLLYKGQAKLDLIGLHGSGTLVTLQLPLEAQE